MSQAQFPHTHLHLTMSSSNANDSTRSSYGSFPPDREAVTKTPGDSVRRQHKIVTIVVAVVLIVLVVVIVAVYVYTSNTEKVDIYTKMLHANLSIMSLCFICFSLGLDET